MAVEIIDFRPHTWETWQAEYRTGIRCIVEWGKLKRPKVLNEMVNNSRFIYYPWREGKKSWMDSGTRLRRIELGFSKVAVRVPAVEFYYEEDGMATDNARLILDGSHRIKELKPEFLIILETLTIGWIVPISLLA